MDSYCYKKYKYIHHELLNSSLEFRENFFEGYYLGDGRHDLNVSKRFDVNSKITSQCLVAKKKLIKKN